MGVLGRDKRERGGWWLITTVLGTANAYLDIGLEPCNRWLAGLLR